MNTRSERIRKARNWSQGDMAAYLRVTQATVSRMESTGREPGPVSRLLDILEAESLSAAANPPPGPAADACRSDAVLGASDRQFSGFKSCEDA